MNAPTKARSGYPHKAKVIGFVQIARELQIDVAGFEVSPDGTIRVFEARAAPAEKTDFDRYKDQL